MIILVKPDNDKIVLVLIDVAAVRYRLSLNSMEDECVHSGDGKCGAGGPLHKSLKYSGLDCATGVAQALSCRGFRLARWITGNDSSPPPDAAAPIHCISPLICKKISVASLEALGAFAVALPLSNTDCF